MNDPKLKKEPLHVLWNFRQKKWLKPNDRRWLRIFLIYYVFQRLLCVIISKLFSKHKVPLKKHCDRHLCSNCHINQAMSSFYPSIFSFKCDLYFKSSQYLLLYIVSSVLFSSVVFADQQSAPHFVVQPSFAGGIVTERQSKILQCQAIGFPPPEFLWYRDDQPLGDFSQDPLLRIPHISKENSGKYWCLARNAAGTVFSEKTSLTVAYMDSNIPAENISITVKDGDAAILKPPPVESIPPVSVSWQKFGFGHLHGGINYAISLENELILLAASTEDEGTYRASVTNPQAGQEAIGGLVQLKVIGEKQDYVPASIILPPKNSIFKQGVYPAILECIVNARPIESVQIIWKKDGQEIALSGLSHLLSFWNRTITLLNVGTMHAGIYECVVSMKEDETTQVKASANVTVIVDPIIILQPQRETVSEIGKAVQIPCSSTGNPTPQVTWHRNSQPVDSQLGERFEIFNNGTLKISSLSGADMGIYQCVAANIGGEASASTWLHVKTSSPDFIKRPVNVTVLDGKDAQISCEVSGAPAPNVT
ncbi:protein sidekick [Caerostris extrusa]|uniref:Protein sidekick n=1 Tax=Caerostris extrusa TaxID=172846 RepID=A0AAV4SEA8_CAEEX|nr:protein sidekick [Caerostris extrusa]